MGIVRGERTRFPQERETFELLRKGSMPGNVAVRETMQRCIRSSDAAPRTAKPCFRGGDFSAQQCHYTILENAGGQISLEIDEMDRCLGPAHEVDETVSENRARNQPNARADKKKSARRTPPSIAAPDMNLESQRSFLIELAERSGDFIRPFFGRHDLAVETKADASPVTAADRGAEELLRRMIQQRFPDHGIIGEEFGNVRGDAEWVWVLDPIDGTKSFMSACPLFGTLIALLHHGQPVLGAIHQPILRQLIIGDGQTTLLNGHRTRVRATTRMRDATLLTSDSLNLAKYQNGPACERVVQSVKLYRTWGDCYGYLLLASGWADVMLDPIMNPWDIAALVPVVKGAGGVITDWHGGDPMKGNSIVAAVPDLHAQVIAELNR